jgi:ATP-dependent Clp protease ATP-binding subunit ClpC
VSTELPIRIDRLDPALRRATADLGTVLAAAVEAGSPSVEPSHFLVALARVAGGTTGRLFAAAQVPVDVFVTAMRRRASDGPPVTELTADTASDATARMLATLDGWAEDDLVADEHAVLAVALTHLEPAAREVLVHHGGVDLDAWLAVATREPLAPASVWDGLGRISADGFTPAAVQVLDAVVTEAAALAVGAPGTLLLAHAMAVPQRGLLAQGAVHLRFDLRDLRARLLLLLRGDGRRETVPAHLTRDAVAPALRLAVEHAARSAAARGAARVAERDLLEALIRTPGSPVSGVLRAAAVDLPALQRFAAEIYVEPEVGPAPEPESVADALQRFQERLIGQPAVVARLLPKIELIKRAARRGFRIGDRPLATFLFCGPSGTGKTMTARLIAEAVYGSADDLIMFEMGQYNSRHAINNFIGAPPGYVGFGEGKLTNGLARSPRCVLLFDEVEKADPLVLDALLRLLDEGRVTDPAGPVRDARDAVVVLTSNLGARGFAALGRQAAGGVATGPSGLHGELAATWRAGAEEEDPAAVSAKLRDELESFLRPEFLNRIDETVLFAPFTPADLLAIAVATLNRRAAEFRAELGIELLWSPDVAEHVVHRARATRVDEAARGVVRCADTVLGLLLRFLDDAEDRGVQPGAARVVVADGELAVVAADG